MTDFAEKLSRLAAWAPGGAVTRITCVDAHTEGEPLRIITGGLPPLLGDSILDRRHYMRRHLDHLRKALMWEPRGHADMYGCVITPPATEDADFGVLFLHNEGYSTMCGHGIIAVTTVAIDAGLLKIDGPECTVQIDTPAGRVTAFAEIRAGRAARVYFHNVPSFVVELGAAIDVDGLGTITYDLAFGGAYYAFVEAARAGLNCKPESFRQLIDAGMRIKRSIMTSREIHHPLAADLNFLYGTIFTGPPENPRHHSRNVCVFADGEVDRSPTGTGVSARMAIHHAREELAIGDPAVIESIIGSTFTASVVRTVDFAGIPSVIPQVEGRAYITGKSEFVLDPEDPLVHGFLLR